MSSVRRTSRLTGLAPLVSAAAPDKSAEALAERHAPASECPALAAHLVVRRHVRMGEVTWVVKNPERDAYYTFSDGEWGVIELFDGSRTRQQIAEQYSTRYGASVDLGFVLEYEEMLRNIELLERSSAERNLALLQKFKTDRRQAAEAKVEGFNPFFIKFHVLNPDRFLNRTVRFVRWIWSPVTVAVWAVAAAWTVGVFALHFAEIWAGTYELYAFLRKPLLDAIQFFLILSIVGGIHEFGHAYATKIYGGEVRDIGMALLYFTPAFYCDTTDSLLFESKWQRLWVTTAGIYIEGFICSAATALWVASYPDTLLHELAYKTMLFTGVSTVFFNINPLIKIDGYYALANYLEIPELREEAFRYLGSVFQRKVLKLGVEVPTVSRRKRRIYWIYGMLALAYTAVLMRFIGGLFYNLYSRYFPDLAIVLLLVTLYRVYLKRIRLVTRTARLFYLDKKEFLMSRRTRLPLAVGVALVLAVVLVPWSHRMVSVEAALQPYVVVSVQAPEDGIVAEVLTSESAPVPANGALFRLQSAAAAAGQVQAREEEERFARAARTASEDGRATAVYENERRQSAAEAAVTSERARGERLLLRSPLSGRTLTPRVADLQGRLVRAGTLLAQVGDCSRLVAELPVSERLLDDLRVGAPVHALSRSRPLRPIRGTIERISTATSSPPSTSSGLNDPPAPGMQSERFVARAVFDNSDGDLRPGDLVRAKIVARRASYAARGLRVLTRWLRTIFW